jgi:iron complex outermembrane receptor protein
VEGEGGEGGILEPETANSYEAGVKTELLGRRLRVELAGSSRTSTTWWSRSRSAGCPRSRTSGRCGSRGSSCRSSTGVGENLYSRGSYGLHDARFRDYLTQFDGVPTQLDGNRFEMSPHHLAALGVSWSPAEGFFASGELNYVGSRYLNKRNTALAESYSTLAALLGWRHGRYEVRLSGRNLTDQRDPVAESELGDAQYYRLFPRHFELAGAVRYLADYGRTCSSTAKSPGFQAWAMT